MTFTAIVTLDGETWVADSPNLAGWHAGAATLEDLRALISEAVPFFTGRNAEVIEVHR